MNLKELLINMRTRKEFYEKHLTKLFIESIQKDFDKWERTYISTYDGGGYYRYLSPRYDNVRFGFDDCFLSYEGVWIDGVFDWQIPNSVLLNPFNSYFWEYRNVKKFLKNYSSNKFLKEKIEKYLNVINEFEKIPQLSSHIREGKLKGNQKHPKFNSTSSLPPPVPPKLKIKK